MRTAIGGEFDVPDGYLDTVSVGIASAQTADAEGTGGYKWLLNPRCRAWMAIRLSLRPATDARALDSRAVAALTG